MKKLFVRNMSYDLTDDQLKEIFESAGTVVSAKVITDRYTGNSRGFGFVEMSTKEEAQKAIEMFHEQELEGRNLLVNEARPQKPREYRPRNDYGQSSRRDSRRDN